MSVDPSKVVLSSSTTSSNTDEDTGKTAAVQSTSATPASVTVTPPAQAQNTSTSAQVTNVTTTLDVVARVPKRGEIVDYVLKDGYHQGEKRPLIITRVWGDTPDALINGQVITDSFNDFITAHPGASGLSWATSVKRDDTGKELGTWSFPE